MLNKRVKKLSGKKLSLKEFERVRNYFKISNIPGYGKHFDVLDRHWGEEKVDFECEICGKNSEVSRIYHTTGGEFMESYPQVTWWYGSDGDVFSHDYRLTLTEQGRREIEILGELDRTSERLSNQLQQYYLFTRQNMQKKSVVCDGCKDNELPPRIVERVRCLKDLGIDLDKVIITLDGKPKGVFTKITNDKTDEEIILLKPEYQK